MRSWMMLFMLLPSVAVGQQALCGNGVVEYGEFCDDGNNVENDWCSANCLFGAPPQEAQPTAQPAPREAIRPGKAFGLSFLSAYFMGGLVPSLGHLYAGERQRAYASWRLRMLADGVFLVSTTLALQDFFSGPKDPTFEGISNHCDFGVIGACRASFLIIPSILLGTATNIFDMIDAPFAARRANQRGTTPWSGGGWPYLSMRPTLLPNQGSLSVELKL